jgi:hypothetical protein
MDELDDPWERAGDDAYGSRRLVGYDKSLVSVITPSQFNWTAPLRLEVSDTPPSLDTDAWDHVVEVPLPAPSGTLLSGFRRRRTDRDDDSARHVSRPFLRPWLHSRSGGDRGARDLPTAAVAGGGVGTGLAEILGWLRHRAPTRVSRCLQPGMLLAEPALVSSVGEGPHARASSPQPGRARAIHCPCRRRGRTDFRSAPPSCHAYTL